MLETSSYTNKNIISKAKIMPCFQFMRQFMWQYVVIIDDDILSNGKNKDRLNHYRNLAKAIYPQQAIFLIRCYDLSASQKMAILHEVSLLAKPYNHKVIIARDYDIFHQAIAANLIDGIHIPEFCFDKLMKQLLIIKQHKPELIISCSAHSEDILNKYNRINQIYKSHNSKFHYKMTHKFNTKIINIVLFSPIFKTRSHPDAAPKGYLSLAKYAHSYHYLDVFALGGVSHDNISQIKQCNIAGIASISGFC